MFTREITVGEILHIILPVYFYQQVPCNNQYSFPWDNMYDPKSVIFSLST